MSIMVEPDARWGETRAEAKAARRRRRKFALGGTAVAVMIGIPFVDGLIDGFDRASPGPTPGWPLDAMVVPLLVLAVFVAGKNWREMDEVQRALAVQTWAVIGLSQCLLALILEIAAQYAPIVQPARTAWLASAAIGVLFHVVRRWQA